MTILDPSMSDCYKTSYIVVMQSEESPRKIEQKFLRLNGLLFFSLLNEFLELTSSIACVVASTYIRQAWWTGWSIHV